VDPSALVRDQYTRMAVVYEERVVPRFQPIARRTAELASLSPGERVLDVGCGTGLATFLAAEAVGPQGDVVGVDISEGQLGIAEAQRLRRGLAHVRFEVADVTQAKPRAEFDVALSNLGIPPEHGLCFAAMRAALRRGGRLSIAAWEGQMQEPFATHRAALPGFQVQDPEPELAALRQAALQRRAGLEEVGTAASLQDALQRAGFAGVEVRREAYAVQFAGWRAAYDFVLSWGVAEHEIRAMPGPQRKALQEALAERWGAGDVRCAWRLLHATGRRQA